jgi:rhamnulose-1-phosphate aldolase
LDELLASMGAGGTRISEIDASEAGAGNISVYIGWDIVARTGCRPGEHRATT